MGRNSEREPANAPEDLSRLFLERANAGDVDGVVALYEPEAVLVDPAGQRMMGSEAIRRFYERLFAERSTFVGDTQAALRRGELALTSTRFSTKVVGPDGRSTTLPTATVEVARRQLDGTWLWVIDQPNILA